MTATDHGLAAGHPRRPFAFRAVIEDAKRAAKQHPFLIAIAVIALWGGGVAGGVIALNSQDAFQAAPTCRGASAYVYEVPGYPAQRPTAPAWPPGGNSYWGWMASSHALQVGNWVRVIGGGVWKVAAIAASPHQCEFFAVGGLAGSTRPPGGSLAGRLVLQPVG
jgi:hypothetical protein